MTFSLKPLSAVLLFAAAHACAQDAAVIEKANAYIQCYNRADGRGHDSIHRYASWVADMEKGPSGNEENIYGVYTIGASVIRLCKEGVTKALALEPAAGELDEAAKAYLDALLPLSERLDAADKYYARENYKDDGFAQGREMHKPLTDAMRAFSAAGSELRARLGAYNDAVRAAQLAGLEKQEGRSFNYHLLAVMIAGKSAAEMLAEEQFDAEAAGRLVATFEETADALEAYMKDHPDEKPVAMVLLDSALEECRVALKQRLRRVRDNIPYNEGEKMHLDPLSGWMVEGSEYKVIRAYNRLVEAVNRRPPRLP